MKKFLGVLLAIVMVVGCFAGTDFTTVRATTEIKTNGNGGKTDVGAWYTTYNTTAFWQHRFSNPTSSPVGYKALLANGSYGIPKSGSADEIDFQIEKMAEAGIDFIVFDLTNGGLSASFNFGMGDNLAFILNNAKLTCERLAVWNATHKWKIKYAVAIGTYKTLRESYVADSETGETSVATIGLSVELQAQEVYEQFVLNENYGEYYYEIEDAPLLILHNLSEGNALTCDGGWNSYSGDKTYGLKFALRHSNSVADAGSYGWYTKGNVSDDNACGAVADEEVMLVSPGQCNHSDGNTTPNASREDGAHYRTNWEAVLESQPRIVMISSLNDYMEDTAIWPTDTSECIVEEAWTTDGETDPYKYWDMTVDYIESLHTKNGDAVLNASQRASDNLVLGMLPSTPSYTTSKLDKLTDGENGYSAEYGHVLYGAGSTQNNETYYQFDFEDVTKLNCVELYLSKQETHMWPYDIAVDVKLSDGTWKRVATRQNIDYTSTDAENITVAEDGVVICSHLEFAFPTEECLAFRVTANRQRGRVLNDKLTATWNWKLTEIEAYYDTALAAYTGIDDLDDATYNIDVIEERYPSQGKTVTTNSTHTATKGLDYITNNTIGTINTVNVGFNQGNNLLYLDIDFGTAEPVNRVDIYRYVEWASNYSCIKRDARDMTIDVLEPSGKYTRVAEIHDISQFDGITTSKGVQLNYYFQAIVGTGIRITFNKTQDGLYKNNPNASGVYVSPDEINVFYDATVTESMYTGIQAVSTGQGSIPEYASQNYSLDGKITSSNTDANLTAAYPVSRINDGYNTRDDSCSIINYMQNNLAWYQVSFASKRTVNEVDLYFSKYEPTKLPQDMGVDVLVDGTWKRVADLHNITYATAGDGTLAESETCKTITFSPVDCTAIRVVASKARNSSSNFRMVEMECYYNPSVTTYTGRQDLDDIAYASTVYGDVNLDMVADEKDLLLVRQKLIGLIETNIYDVRYDDVCDARDLVCVKKAISESQE